MCRTTTSYKSDLIVHLITALLLNDPDLSPAPPQRETFCKHAPAHTSMGAGVGHEQHRHAQLLGVGIARLVVEKQLVVGLVGDGCDMARHGDGASMCSSRVLTICSYGTWVFAWISAKCRSLEPGL